MDHPTMSDTQVVVLSKTADLQRVIGALTAKGKESGVQGPNKFILLGENGSCNDGSFCQPATDGDDVSVSITAGQPVKAELAGTPPDVKPLTELKQCMHFFYFKYLPRKICIFASAIAVSCV